MSIDGANFFMDNNFISIMKSGNIDALTKLRSDKESQADSEIARLEKDSKNADIENSIQQKGNKLNPEDIMSDFEDIAKMIDEQITQQATGNTNDNASFRPDGNNPLK